MPRFDKTGPLGRGPMTGRGLGNCIISEEQRQRMIEQGPNASSTVRDERGRGMGRGWRWAGWRRAW